MEISQGQCHDRGDFHLANKAPGQDLRRSHRSRRLSLATRLLWDTLSRAEGPQAKTMGQRGRRLGAIRPSISITPEVLKPLRTQFSVPNGVRDVLVPEVLLD
jgi:hypothetical protein